MRGLWAAKLLFRLSFPESPQRLDSTVESVLQRKAESSEVYRYTHNKTHAADPSRARTTGDVLGGHVRTHATRGGE